MGRILAFDYGTKRIGLAVTDPLKLIATGLGTVHPKDIMDFLQKYFQKEAVEAFVLGDPRQMDGSPSENAQHVVGFSRSLQKAFPDIPQYWVNERNTSQQAHAAMRAGGLKKQARANKALVDEISATLILQYFMDQARLD